MHRELRRSIFTVTWYLPAAFSTSCSRLRTRLVTWCDDEARGQPCLPTAWCFTRSRVIVDLFRRSRTAIAPGLNPSHVYQARGSRTSSGDNFFQDLPMQERGSAKVLEA